MQRHLAARRAAPALMLFPPRRVGTIFRIRLKKRAAPSWGADACTNFRKGDGYAACERIWTLDPERGLDPGDLVDLKPRGMDHRSVARMQIGIEEAFAPIASVNAGAADQLLIPVGEGRGSVRQSGEECLIFADLPGGGVGYRLIIERLAIADCVLDNTP